MARKVRRHGLERPFSNSQIATWVVVPLMSASYLFTAATFFEDLEVSLCCTCISV